jgi:hypothetical protein
VDSNAQAHLAGLISFARVGLLGSADDDDWRRRAFSGFSSALAALRAVGAVADEESSDWTNRMLVAVGLEPVEPMPSGISGARVINLSGKQRQRPPGPPPASVFLGLVPANDPDRPLDYGGRLQILGLELYSDKLTVNWRLAPEPDYELVFAYELAEQEPDLEGLSEEHRNMLRRQLVHRLQMRRRLLRISDDVGTEYHSGGGGSSGGGGEKRGHTDFRPAVPAEASRAIVRWDDSLEFVVRLEAGHK